MTIQDVRAAVPAVSSKATMETGAQFAIEAVPSSIYGYEMVIGVQIPGEVEQRVFRFATAERAMTRERLLRNVEAVKASIAPFLPAKEAADGNLA